MAGKLAEDFFVLPLRCPSFPMSIGKDSKGTPTHLQVLMLTAEVVVAFFLPSYQSLESRMNIVQHIVFQSNFTHDYRKPFP